MRVSLLLMVLWLASVTRCDEPGTRGGSKSEPKPGDTVTVLGRLDEDVDCRVLRAEDGRVYSLSSRVRGMQNGTQVCVHGTLAEVSACMTQPMIEVQSVRGPSACP